jgi:hypothetical protein
MLTPYNNPIAGKNSDFAIMHVELGTALGCDLQNILKQLAARTSARYVLLDLSSVADAEKPPLGRETEPCMRSEVYFG